jgi:hypothetical protein
LTCVEIALSDIAETLRSTGVTRPRVEAMATLPA